MRRELRVRVRPKPGNTVRVCVFAPKAIGAGFYNAGGLQLSESLWRLLLYPLLQAGAVRCGVTLTLES